MPLHQRLNNPSVLVCKARFTKLAHQFIKEGAFFIGVGGAKPFKREIRHYTKGFLGCAAGVNQPVQFNIGTRQVEQGIKISPIGIKHALRCGDRVFIPPAAVIGRRQHRRIKCRIDGRMADGCLGEFYGILGLSQVE